MQFKSSHLQMIYSTLTFINSIVTMATYFVIAIFFLQYMFYLVTE